MRDLKKLEYHKTSEKLVEVLKNKTQNPDPLFFRVQVAYYFAKVASMMRCKINTHDRGVIPVNLYVINLATSGQGKGHSTNIIEESVINQFRDIFVESTLPIISEVNLAKIAVSRAYKRSNSSNSPVDPDEELAKVKKEFESLGNLAFSFDSATTAAIKQMRHKLLMADAGSMNMEIDEIGSNLLGQSEVLSAYLELFDVGKIKQKLTKNTAENVRSEEIDGKTPANMLLYGTPTKLFDGGKVEETFMSLLDTGYGRRCLFGYNKTPVRSYDQTPEEIYAMLTDNTTDSFLEDISDTLGTMADRVNFDKLLVMSKEVSLLIIEYRSHCERTASFFGEHEEIRKAEMSHRYFKALKLAGAYAFIDQSHEITEDHFYNAIALTEESGDALSQLLNRDRNYVKLAKYIAEVGREVTHVDLVEDLPFYKGSESQKRELMTLAVAYGYKNNIIIKRMFSDGIEFLHGESLKVTNLDEIIVSYGTDLAKNYANESVPFNQLHKLTQEDGYHWVAHHLLDGIRREENAIPGFNVVAIDIDNGLSMQTAAMLMKDYKFLMYETKRSTPSSNRFRLILPMNYTLNLDAKDYKEFMSNISEWLPFSIDEQTKQRARKWLSCNKYYEYNDGALLDALLFIPKTSKNEERKKAVDNQQSLSNLERWFVNNTGIGNRSHQLVKYAYLLVDAGYDIETVTSKVLGLNSKLSDKLDDLEIHSTILTSAARSINKRDSA